MIIDINQHDERLDISYIESDGNIQIMEIEIPSDQQFIWEYCNPAEKPHPNVKSWDGKGVKKVRSKFLNKWRIEEFLISQPQWIKDKLYTLHQPKMFFVDIETEVTDDGFAKPSTAKNAVTAIAFSSGNKVIALGTRKLSAESIGRIGKKINDHFKDYSESEFNYIYFESEYDMLYSFMGKAIHKMPLVTGWNFVGPKAYDWPYLVNRCKKLGIDPAISSTEKKLIGKSEIPMHRILVDYLGIYKKWDKSIDVKENNTLNFVSKAVLGLNKIKYSGTLQDLYESNFEDYIFYNAVDARLVQLIHEKLQTVQTFLTLANFTGVEAQRAFSPIWMAESVMAREFYQRHKVFPRIKDSRKTKQKYEGAFVFKPKPGIYEWIGALDFASLYPSIMRQWNISPESYVTNTLEEIDNTKFIKTSSGAVFRNDEDSVFRTILTDYYGKRSKAKKEMQVLEKEIDYLKKFLVKATLD